MSEGGGLDGEACSGDEDGTLPSNSLGGLFNLSYVAFSSNRRTLPIKRLKHQFLENSFYLLRGNASPGMSVST